MTTSGGSGMARELREAPDAVRRQEVSRDAVNDLVARCRANPPRLVGTCDIVLPMTAGPELSVAATKTFVTALAMLLRITAAWSEDDAMSEALDRLPERLAQAGTLDWSAPLGALEGANSLVTIGRGPT